jgi:hypothetical protein
VGITFSRIGSFLSWTINLGFLTEGKTLLLYSSYLPLGVPNLTVKNYQHRHASFISLSHGVIFMWSWSLYLVELVDVTLHLLCYSSAFILVISRDTLSHDVKVTVCVLCVSLRLKFTVILIMSYDLSWMSVWIVGVCLEPSSALKVTVWGNLDWGMQTLRSAL